MPSPFNEFKTLGNISASTTISASSTECLAIWLRAENTWRCIIVLLGYHININVLICTFNLASLLPISSARCPMAPESTTVWASYCIIHIKYQLYSLTCNMYILTSGECFAMSLRADAAILLTEISGSCTHNTNNGTAPASTTACAKSVENQHP